MFLVGRVPTCNLFLSSQGAQHPALWGHNLGTYCWGFCKYFCHQHKWLTEIRSLVVKKNHTQATVLCQSAQEAAISEAVSLTAFSCGYRCKRQAVLSLNQHIAESTDEAPAKLHWQQRAFLNSCQFIDCFKPRYVYHMSQYFLFLLLLFCF